jgi:hypothetical protein
MRRFTPAMPCPANDNSRFADAAGNTAKTAKTGR